MHDRAGEELKAEQRGLYVGPSTFRELGHYLGAEIAAALSVAVVAGWWSGLLEYLWAPLAGVALLVVLAGRGVIRDARWDELGVEFRWLYGRPTVYPWDELRKVARPGRWRRAEGSGLLLFTRHGEMIEIKSNGEGFSAFADAPMAKLPVEGS